MKNFVILLFMLTAIPTLAADCQPQPQLAEHMRELGHLADRIYSGYDNEERLNEMVENLQLMRSHLAAALVLVPAKLQRLRGNDLDIKKMEYQEVITKMISLNLLLEKTFRIKPQDEMQKMQRSKTLNETLALMSQTIGQGHERFRNRR